MGGKKKTRATMTKRDDLENFRRGSVEVFRRPREKM